LATILSVVPFHVVPPQSGGQNAIAGFNDFLGRKHKVLMVSTPLNKKGHTYTFTIYSLFSKSRLRYVNIFKALAIAKLCRKNRVQYLIAEQPFISLLTWFVSRICSIPFYLRNHNIEFERARSTGKWWWKLAKPYERWAMRKADACFFITPYDMDLAIDTFKLPAEKCYIVPYGVYNSKATNESEKQNFILNKYNLQPDEKILLFFGLLNYQPNIVAVDLILEKINPLLLNHPDFKYKILICGKGLPDRFNGLADYADKNIIHAGFVENIDAYIQSADVILNPVITGGGIKTKIVEAISLNKNVVSTRTGAIGVDEDICGGKLLVSDDDDWNTFASNIINSSSLRINTPQSFFNNFYWGNIVDRMSGLFK
jgi:polysaccharide biosynthesis protein PslH